MLNIPYASAINSVPVIRSSAAYVTDNQLMDLRVWEGKGTGFPNWDREMKALTDAMASVYSPNKVAVNYEEDTLYVGCGRRIPYLNGWCCDLDPNVGEGIPHFIHADAQDLPWDDETFKWVLSSHTLEHVQDCALALREQCRVVKVGGVVGAIVPDVRWTGGLDPTHVREYTRDEFCSVYAIVEAVRGGSEDRSEMRMRLVASGEAEHDYSFFAVWVREV